MTLVQSRTLGILTPTVEFVLQLLLPFGHLAGVFRYRPATVTLIHSPLSHPDRPRLNT